MTHPPPAPKSLRLFYGLRVPTQIATELAGVQTRLKGNWRSVNPSHMHITLCYLPVVAPEHLNALKRLGVSIAETLPPLQLSLRGTGYFPNEGSPRVWFVKVEGDGLSELAERLREGVVALGLEHETLAFKPHITLARKKGPAPRLPPLLFDSSWTATSMTLYRSILRKTGPVYEAQSTFRFRSSAASLSSSSSEDSVGDQS